MTGLTLDRDYSFYVTALNPTIYPGEGPVSERLTVRAAGFPQAPTPITEVVGSRTGASIGLEWPAPTDTGDSAIVSYTLAIIRENQAHLLVYHGIATKAVVEGLTSGQEYQFKVKATTAVGDSAWSASTYQFLIVDQPSPPLNLELLAYDNTYVRFRW